MMDTVTAGAEKGGFAAAAAIVDAGGNAVLVQRMDGGRFHTVHSCTTKAVCAASNKRPTTMKGAAGQSLDSTHALGLALAAGADRWTAMEGGYPVIVDGECIGGIGAGGAHLDPVEPGHLTPRALQEQPMQRRRECRVRRAARAGPTVRRLLRSHPLDQGIAARGERSRIHHQRRAGRRSARTGRGEAHRDPVVCHDST